MSAKHPRPSAPKTAPAASASPKPPIKRSLAITKQQADLLHAADARVRLAQDQLNTLVTAICAGHGITVAQSTGLGGTAAAPTLDILVPAA